MHAERGNKVGYDKLESKLGERDTGREAHRCDQSTPCYTEQTYVHVVTAQNRQGSQLGKFKDSRSQEYQVSKLMIFSLVAMIVGFIMATPLSLTLTIPAYVLADKVCEL